MRDAEDALGVREIGNRLAQHHTYGDSRHGHSGRLAHVGHGARGTRVHFQNVHFAVFHRVLHIHQSDNREGAGQLFGIGFDGRQRLRGERGRRQHTTGVARMHAGFFDVLHDAGDQDSAGGIGDGIHVHFSSVLKEAVDQHRTALREGNRLLHVAADGVLIVGDHHGAAAQHVTGADQHRESNGASHRNSLFRVGGGAVGGRRNLEIVEQLAEKLAIFGQVDVGRIRSDDRNSRGFERERQREWRLSTKLNDHAVGLLGVANVQHFFERERLEVEAVTGVVIGGDRFRIAIDHDRLDTEFLQREGRVAATVIELDALPDAVGSAAENHYLLTRCDVRLALGFVARVEVGSEAFEFRGAGIYTIEDRFDAQLLAAGAHLQRRNLPGTREITIGDAVALRQQELLPRGGRERPFRHFLFEIHHFAHLAQEPGINGGQLMHFRFRVAVLEGEADVTQAVGIGGDQASLDQVFLKNGSAIGLAGFQAPHALAQRLLEGASDGHYFADAFHLRAEHWLGAGEFLKLPAWDLDDYVVDRRLEAGRRQTRNVVLDFIEPIAHGQLGGDLRDGESGSFRGQRRAARHPRIHFDDDHAPGFGIDGELHVGAASIHADLSQARQCRVAHHLILAVGECLRRSNRDGIARVHAHGIEVFNGAYDDGVVGLIAHHFELEFLPAEDALFDQHFMHRR